METNQEVEGLFNIGDDRDIDIVAMIDNVDEIMLKDSFLPWSDVSSSDVQDILMSDVPKGTLSTEFQTEYSAASSLPMFHGTTSRHVYSSMNLPPTAVKRSDIANSYVMHSNEMFADSFVSENTLQFNQLVSSSKIKQEMQERSQTSSELLKLLTNNPKPRLSSESGNVIKSDVQLTHTGQQMSGTQAVQTTPIISPVSTHTKTVPIQHVLPLQTSKIVISPQQTAPALQLCPVLPSQLEDSISSAQVVAVTSNQPAQVVTSTTPQVPVHQLILHTTSSVPRPVQLVIDSNQLPIACSTVNSGNVITAAPKVERHRAHNAIEKKYRTSINDKIKEMKDLLFGADAKIQKSGVLKRAIDHIRQLRNVNNRLRQENASFKMKLQQLGIVSCVKPSDGEREKPVDIIQDPLTPESLDVQSPTSSSSSPAPEDSLSSHAPMFDRTRLTMCIIMLSFFVFDPFHFIFSWQKGLPWSSRTSLPATHHGRFLMSQEPSDIPQPLISSKLWIISSLLGPILRSLTILFIFLKLFVFGEPSLQPDSKIAAKYWAFKRQADLTLEKGDYIGASKVLSRCLEILGRPLPTSRLDLTCSLIWHIFRQIFHRLLITRWLTSKAALLYSLRSADKKEMKYRKESAKQAALVYHKLHQLYLTGHVHGSPWLATVVALNAVNVADMADNSLNEEIRVDIYIDSAIQLRSTLPKNLKFLARYFLSCARKLCRGQSLTLPYSCWWLFTPVGHRFFVSGEWSCRRESHIWSSSRINDNKPLASVTQKFCEFLLEQAMSELLSRPNKEYLGSARNSEGNSHGNRALDLLHTMTECVSNSRKSAINRNFKVFGEVPSWPSEEPDLVGCWWASLGKVAAYWLLGDINRAHQQYNSIENIPDELENNDDSLGQALLYAFRARARLLLKTGEKLDNLHEILEYCDKSGALLRESLAYSSLYPNSHLLKLMYLLCCDWLLFTRAEIWERLKLDGDQHSSCSSLLDGFHKDLKTLQKVASYIPDAFQKVYMYQATGRMIAEANPLKTQRLLQRSVQQPCGVKDKLTGAVPQCSISAEKDRANALILASGYLPSSFYRNNTEPKDMIIDAVECLQKFGEKDRIARCRKLMMSF